MRKDTHGRIQKANSQQLAVYKQNIIAKILEDSELCELINPKLDASELPYINIFPFGKIVGTTDTALAYVTIEVDMPSVSLANNFFKEIIITLRVICHDDLMRTDLGFNRMDGIGIKLEELIADSVGFGFGEVEPISNTEGAWTERHSYRELRFKFLDKARSC